MVLRQRAGQSRTDCDFSAAGSVPEAKTVTGYVIQVKGYASAVSSAALNQKLSQEQAAERYRFPRSAVPHSSGRCPGARSNGHHRQVAPDTTFKGQAGTVASSSGSCKTKVLLEH